MERADVKAIMTGIRENNERLQSCDVHRFPEAYPGVGKRYRCEKCAGEVDASALLNYCEGFAAAGGDASTVWPAYELTKVRILDNLKKL